MKNIKPLQWTFLGITFLLIGLFWTNILDTAHAFCPFASTCFTALSAGNNFSFLVFPIAITVGLIISISTIFLGRIFCGHICPFGTIQDIIFSLKKIKGRPKNISTKYHNLLKIVKYGVFIFVLVSAYFSMHYLYLKFCPTYLLAHPKTIHYFSFVTVVSLLILPFFIPRFWCNYLCPYAVQMNIFMFLGKLLKIKRRKIYRDQESCINCKLCDCNCPMNIVVSKTEYVEDLNCIHCGNCIKKCPKKDCLNYDCTKVENK